MKVQTLKGFRDFLPSQAKKRQYVIDTLKPIFTSFGFEPLETPVLEYEELLLGKYGDEGDKLMYRFTDNGERRVAMRYDQTVPLARVVAQYGSTSSPQDQNFLPMPFKRYQVQPVWRAENTQRGRFREFVQCDIDTVGVDTPLSDAEVISAVARSYQALGFQNFKVLLNDRATFETLPIKAITIIDKLKKIGPERVKEELRNINVDDAMLDEITNKQPTARLTDVMRLAAELGVSESAMQFEPTLARGLDYYTGVIIEIEDAKYSVGSLGGGGRYDNLIGLFAGKQIPAVGFAFGFDRMIEAMDEQKLFPTDVTQSSTKILVTIFNKNLLAQSLEAASQLRDAGIATEIYLSETVPLDKQLKYANQKAIPYVVIIGEDEVKEKKVTLKNLATRDQQRLTLQSVIQKLS
jgi:histidyl-tRNA synthetase